MSRMQQCPYCHTIYRYRDIIGLKGKVQTCYHCQKKFAVRKWYRCIPVIIACILMTVVNLVVFHTSKDINQGTFIVLILTDAAVILLSLLTAPFFTRLVKTARRQK